MTAVLTPGAYLRLRRIAADLSLDDVALGFDTLPHVSARSRAEWLATIEADTAPVDIAFALRLIQLVPFDWQTLLVLIAIHDRQRDPIAAPPICRQCGCTEGDACCRADFSTCAWAPGHTDLCSFCADDAAPVGARAAA